MSNTDKLEDLLNSNPGAFQRKAYKTIGLTKAEAEYLSFVIRADLETVEDSDVLKWKLDKVIAETILEKL